MSALPRTLNELTAERLTELMGPALIGPTRVTSIESRVLGGNGLMSQVAQLRLSYDRDVPGAPAVLIAKLPPLDPGVHSQGVQLGFFEAEAQFYARFAERSAIRTPRCYFTQYDDADGSFLTLLEDLSAARMGNMERGCSFEEGATLMRDLAAFHASWWDSASLAEDSCLQSRKARLETAVPMMEVAWPTFVGRFENGLDADQLRALSTVRGLSTSSIDALAGGTPTLLHGDYKLDNMFFHDNGTATIIDWGLLSTGPAMFDVAFFLGLDFEPAERRRREAQYVRTYVDALAAHDVRGYDFGTAMAEYKVQLRSVLPQLICAGGLAEFADEGALRGYAQGVRRMLAAASDHTS